MLYNKFDLLQVYPLFAAVGVAVGICGFQLVRNICINPEVRYSSFLVFSLPFSLGVRGEGS